MKALIGMLLIWRYGVRGGLRPPTNPLGYFRPTGPRRWARLCYRWRVWCWSVDSRLYDWSGIPERWEDWYRYRKQ